MCVYSVLYVCVCDYSMCVGVCVWVCVRLIECVQQRGNLRFGNLGYKRSPSLMEDVSLWCVLRLSEVAVEVSESFTDSGGVVVPEDCV